MLRNAIVICGMELSYTISGTYTNIYTNTLGCDSIHTLNLTINNSSITTILKLYALEFLQYKW